MAAAPPSASWHAHQLAAYLEAVSELDEPTGIAALAVERAASALAADVVALVRGEELLASLGYRSGDESAGELIAAAHGRRETVTVPGIGVVPVARSRSRGARGPVIIVARAAPGGFAPDEIAVLNGIASATALSLRDTGDGRVIELRPSAEPDPEPAVAPDPAERETTILNRIRALQGAMRSDFDRDRILVEACRDLRELTGAAAVAVRTADGGSLELVAGDGTDNALAERYAILGHERGLGRPVLDGGGLITVLDADETASREELAADRCTAVTIAPIDGPEGPCGTLAAGFDARRIPDGAEDAVLLYAGCCALACARSGPAPDPDGASVDPLTGLEGRRAFMGRAESAIGRTRGMPGGVAVLLIDLDGFRRVNDGLGQVAGDRLLRAAARRFSAVMRPGDFLGRIGGDEFAVLVEDLNGPGEAERVMRRLQSALRRPFDIADREIVMTASVGIGFGAPDASGLMRAATLALAEARTKGAGTHSTYRTALEADALRRLDMEVDIQRALQENQLVVHYQPIFDLERLEPVAFEALVRWRHPVRGLVAPGRFIPIAEQTGLIAPIGRWVLRNACRQLADWRREFGNPELRMSVNVSPDQLQGEGLIRDVEQAIAGANLDPADLILEITESVLMSDTSQNLDRLERLKRLGVSIAIDDFGVGYSSLRYIDRFPIDVVKVDRSFVSDGHEELPVLQAVIELAGNLGLRVVAEGIEDRDLPRRLLEMGCRYGQGLLLGAAAPPQSARALLAPRRGGRRMPRAPR